MFGRYTLADNELVNVAYIPGKGLVRPDNTHHVSVGFTHLFTSNVIGETRLGFSRAFLARQSDGDRTSTNYAAELGLKNLAANPGEYTLPAVNLTDYAPGNPTGTSGFVGYGLRIVQNNFYYRAGQTFTWIRNRHTLKFGGDVSRIDGRLRPGLATRTGSSISAATSPEMRSAIISSEWFSPRTEGSGA